MRAKVARQLNKLAESLMLTRGERKKLKQDYQKTPDRNINDLKARVDRVTVTVESANEPT